MPPTDISELIDGDLAMYIFGDMGDVENPLPVESFRCGEEVVGGFELWSSSELSMDIDLGLGVLCAKGDRGGANALES